MKNTARNKHPEVTVNRILDVATALFIGKGYDKMTIQDIIDNLGDLSKGAIYHHFKSKEDIVTAVLDRLTQNAVGVQAEVMADSSLTGLEKLRKLFFISIGGSYQETVLKALPNLLENSKLLAMQVDMTVNDLAPNIVEPIIREGIKDGSIVTDFPKELAEVMALLADIWINPLVFKRSPEEIYKKCLFFKYMMSSLGMDLLDDEIIHLIVRLGKFVNNAD